MWEGTRDFVPTYDPRPWVGYFRDVSWYSPFCQTAATSGMSVLQASFVVLFFLQVLTETKVISHLAYCTEYIISHMFPLRNRSFLVSTLHLLYWQEDASSLQVVLVFSWLEFTQLVTTLMTQRGRS